MKRRVIIATLRTAVQAGFAFFCLYAGYRFYLFYSWATGIPEDFVPRPPAVEAFLPISALLGLKRMVLTGRYDDIHPAGLTIFLSALTIGLLLRKGFCGWICPVGFVANMIEKAGKKMGLLVRMPIWLDLPLLFLKYALLFFFAYVILWQMDIRAVEAFLYSPYNKVVDGKMLLFFLAPSILAVQVLACLAVISLVVRNFWCRYLCPYGALLGMLAFLGPWQVRRETRLCVNCKKCDEACPASIRISTKRVVRSPECIGCVECVAQCPQKGCLALTDRSGRAIPIYVFPAAVLTIFLIFWSVAVLMGHWDTSVSPAEARQLYPLISMFAHP
jgi:polyferredoxin